MTLSCTNGHWYVTFDGGCVHALVATEEPQARLEAEEVRLRYHA